jgi:uncharacterized membrane protein
MSEPAICDRCRIAGWDANAQRGANVNRRSVVLPSPLHPAIVHFPIVLVFLLPLAVLAALWLIRKGARPSRAWTLPIVTAAALSASAWVAVETGESQEDQVEHIAGEGAMSRHEHAAEQFLLLSLGVLGVTALGLLRGRAGRLARGAAMAGTAVLLLSGYRVGHSGGQLVYGDGVNPGLTGVTTAAVASDREVDHDSDEEDE